MLVLCRKRGEALVIGDHVVVTVVDIDRNQVKLAIEAPRSVTILRDELVAPAAAAVTPVEESAATIPIPAHVAGKKPARAKTHTTAPAATSPGSSRSRVRARLGHAGGNGKNDGNPVAGNEKTKKSGAADSPTLTVSGSY